MIETAKRLHSVKEYYFSEKLREVREMIARGEPVINIGIGSPDLPPPPQAVEAMQDAVSEAGAHRYQSYQGIPELRRAMADFYRDKFGVELDFNTEVLPLMGSKEGIMHISLAFLNAGDEVLIPDPGYATYTSVTRLVQAVPRYYALKAENGWLPDIDALEKENLSGVKLMWISYPHMPTGARASGAFLEKLVAFAKAHRILLVNDNPYSFVLNDASLSLLKIENAKPVCLELNSLSKTFNMAGWRIGMVSGDAAHIDAVLRVKSNMDSGMFYPLQQGAIAALNAGEAWFREINAVYEKRRALVFTLASALECRYDTNTAGLFVWAKLPPGIPSSEAFAEKLLHEKHIFVVPGMVFGKNGEGYVRFSLCASEAVIKEAIARI
ncbi:MAG: aminotransferase class I/II-fold pyridoxal phosphate-dependent enzyme [Sinomicrobium sp.]|nr:aminotransferase class I/II-fold pyridoxal phosphate-dependent enzyme [Sinomicrobium sp.]